MSEPAGHDPDTVRSAVRERSAAAARAVAGRSGCCTATELSTCCEPEAKDACCGAEASGTAPSSCGCR